VLRELERLGQRPVRGGYLQLVVVERVASDLDRIRLV
jgi:hypothetical protein